MSMMQAFRFIIVGMVLTMGRGKVSQAAGDPNFRAMAVSPVISIFESPDLRDALRLTAEQLQESQPVLDDWKSRFLAAKAKYDARPAAYRRGPYILWRDTALVNSVSDLLDEEQHQKLHQMLTLFRLSPVQASAAFRFDLELKEEQHEQLLGLETQWVLHAMNEVDCEYRFPRHTEERDISKLGALLRYGPEVLRVAWTFTPVRDARWNEILTPLQAKHWKQRELQSIFAFRKLDVLLLDFRSARESKKPLNTGTWMDDKIPYLVPPFEVLQFSEDQLIGVRELIDSVRYTSDSLPNDPAERNAMLAKREQQEMICLQKIEQIMTEQQREVFWDMIGEPTAGNRFLKALKTSSDAAWSKR